ncbi:nickel transporter [Streptomyces sp. NBC_00887]|uniref:nickel transporter n=1 Tax=Streptomyces sp. NBC_00887 TaxID=2975859 RepID=UPI00386CE7B4|nr:nickel transporter [Streptomyces sp. NBC_00887]WSY35791.1 nickel transporter [Streptomyces sp. NBC_00887]
MIRRTAACALATLATGTVLALLPARAAQAHPLGNFTVNQYDGLVVVPGQLSVDHVEDLAEIPASQERIRIDTDRDDRLAPDELSAWARARCDAAAEGARFTVGGRDAGGTGVSVSVRSAKAQVRAGQAGLQTLRVTCGMAAPLQDGARLRLSYRPADVATGVGWREITARGDRMTISGAGVPDTSRSRRLTAYPDDLLSSPPDSRSATFTVRPGGSALRAGTEDEANASPALGVLPRGTDRWTQALTGLVARHELTVGFAALALVVSLLLGAMHALAPGHGKTMMAAAAAAGGRGSLRDMLALGASVTLTHTLGVFALGALITAGSAAAPTVVSWLGIASGALVAVAGVLLLRRGWRLRHRTHGPGHHGSRASGHEHAPAHERGEDTGTPHGEERVPALATVRRAEHSGETADRSPTPAGTGQTHGDDHHHGHDHSHPHSHSHSHVPPAPGLRGVILLGLAGGLVPSPSAVVVLIGAAALGQAWFGFLLVLSYGGGLALTLAGAGFLVVRLRETTARRLVQRPRSRVLARAHRLAPLATASVVLILGCGLVFRGLATALS